ncbi:MAG: hypothetical protein K8S14_02535 [Actinomycetia bacterium]|nr:hypothetical protein [Actinomycetes bacterium]
MDSENHIIIENEKIKVVVEKNIIGGKEEFYTRSVSFFSGKNWNTIFTGIEGQEFCTSFKNSGAQTCEIIIDEGEKKLKLSSSNEIWEAEEEITINSSGNIVTRRQKYRFLLSCRGYINPGYMIRNDDTLRYTYPLQVYDRPMDGLPAMRCDSTWAVPLPCHILSTDQWVAVYGIDRNMGAGTLDFQPLDDKGYARLGTFYPDTVEQDQNTKIDFSSRKFNGCEFSIGQEIELVEFISVKQLESGDIPLFAAEKLAAELLLKEPFPGMNRVDCADRIANFYNEGSLWERNAFEKGHGWFRNFWIYTTGKNPEKGSCFDLGWGEGYGVLTMNALALNWKRTGNSRSLAYLDEMTRNIDYFKRNPEEDGAYYDRYFLPHINPVSGTEAPIGDFMGFKRIWSHSLGNIGYQLLNLYNTVEDYPDLEISRKWLKTGLAIGDFFALHQTDEGDIQDGFEQNDSEANEKSYRIPARTVVCGLWTIAAKVSGDASYLQRALKLSRAVSGEIERYDFYGQMLDTHGKGVAANSWDAENACYALLGLTELYLATSDEKVSKLCKISAAYIFSWVYHYNLPNGFNGWTRGGTTCRMPAFPLLYVGAGALAVIPLIRLAEKTGELFYKQMAEEILGCIAKYQWRNSDKPWDGGIVHALDQNSGAHWGPDRLGQVDSGMTTGMSLAALEYWIEKIVLFDKK